MHGNAGGRNIPVCDSIPNVETIAGAPKLVLHPVQSASADEVATRAVADESSRELIVPLRTAAVFVESRTQA